MYLSRANPTDHKEGLPKDLRFLTQPQLEAPSYLYQSPHGASRRVRSVVSCEQQALLDSCAVVTPCAEPCLCRSFGSSVAQAQHPRPTRAPCAAHMVLFLFLGRCVPVFPMKFGPALPSSASDAPIRAR